MTKESGTTAISDPDQPVDLESPPAATAPPPVAAPGAVALALLSLGWLAAMLWSAKAEISSSEVSSMAITSAAYALPGVISASLVSGAAVSVTLANLLTRLGVRRSTPRFAAALAAGLATGLLAALVVTLSYGDGSAIMVLAGTTAAAATVGGIAGGLRGTLVVAAIVTAGLAVFAVGFALSYYQEPLLSLYGSGDTQASQLTAFRWFSRTSSLAGGLAAGLLAFGYLRLAGRRIADRTGAAIPLRGPAYLIAGAGAGLLLLTAEVLTRTAGAEVLRLAGAVSEADSAGQNWLGGERIIHGMLVLFVGALTALIAFGRTLRPVEESMTGTTPEPRDPDHDGAVDGRGSDDGHPEAGVADDGDTEERAEEPGAEPRAAADGPDEAARAGTGDRAEAGDRAEPDDGVEPDDRPEPASQRVGQR
ncbi:hypothetical protein ACFP2T_00150 [Plantactinospora solaniradicis]|uniref:Uncharacterized protein n=1 Tax=Plantactinospora solaniradicis TaxID=1723736 RepID=A0ABW1K0W9_9ACTN